MVQYAMQPILLDLYPNAKTRAFTMTFDDGVSADRRLVELFNQYGIRGTFHLNTNNLKAGNHIRPDEVKSLYKGHEVSCHTVSHPHLTQLSDTDILNEVMEDRKTLEALMGQPVRGFAYPFGSHDDRVVNLLSGTGLAYARTTQILPSFDFPNSNFLRMGFSCRHNEALPMLEKLMARPAHSKMQAMIVMGHSYEFDRPNVGWDNITALCKAASNQENFWYTTLIELVDYTLARKQLQFSADGRIVHNPTFTPIWATYQKSPLMIAPGQTIQVD
jgi:peptidoglycan-N-acetylglucosamine deacetylase